jgi:hypothetical protein
MLFGECLVRIQKEPSRVMRNAGMAEALTIKVQPLGVDSETSALRCSYLAITDGTHVSPWNPTQTDMFSDEWDTVNAESGEQ